MTNDYSIKGTTLKQRIEAMPEDSILFRSDFTEYHTEFVGSVLSELTAEGMLVKISYGIYAKPRRSKFGVVSENLCYGSHLFPLLVQALKTW